MKVKLIEFVQKAIEKVTKGDAIKNTTIPKSQVDSFLLKASKQYDLSEKSSKRTEVDFFDKLSRMANEEVTIGTPAWELVGGVLYLKGKMYEMEEARGGKHGYEYSFYDLHQHLRSEGIDATETGKSVSENYTKEELEEAATWIDPEVDYKQKYLSAVSFMTSYSEIDTKGRRVSLPQERYLTVALFLSQNEEKSKRLERAKELYWHLINKTLSPATPIMANANKRHHQLSSCFIDTTDDNLNDIYASNKDLANVSKYGGGIGVYMGKVRARGSSIQGVPGVSGGTLPWIKQLNGTAVSVDQLG